MKITNTHLTITISDLDKSIAFYTSIGFTLEQQWENHYAQMRGPGIEIGLHRSTQVNATGASNMSIGLTVDDFATASAHLKELGIAFSERSEEGGEFIHFTDPDENPIYIIKPSW